MDIWRKWEKDYFHMYRGLLHQITDFNEMLKNELLASNAISLADIEELNKTGQTNDKMQINMHLFNILTKNPESYMKMRTALIKCNQIQAAGFLPDPKDPVINLNYRITPPTSLIEYSTKEKLGEGSTGIVYKGTFGGNVERSIVAVKVLPNLKENSEAETEIQNLLKCNKHENIVRYIHSEKGPNVYLIAFELCEKFTLADWVPNPNCLQIEISQLDILKQTTKGLGYLHTLNIIHQDLKPSNILFSLRGNEAVVKISDFGISRNINPGRNSKTFTSFGLGTSGWRATEVLENESMLRRSQCSQNDETLNRITNKVDIFSLGCVYYYVLTKEEHPFGNEERLWDYNIEMGYMQLSDKHSSLSPQCNLSLVKQMINKNPDKRPDTEYIKAHPIFWSEQKMIDFIQEISNFVEEPPEHVKNRVEKCVEIFEEMYYPQISSNESIEQGWLIRIENEEFKNHSVFKHRFVYKNTHKSAMKLVRLIRNFSNHCHTDKNIDLVKFVGYKPKGFMHYWLKCFPTLIIELRDAFEDFKENESLKRYYMICKDNQE